MNLPTKKCTYPLENKSISPMNFTYRQDDIGRCERDSNILFYYRSSHWATTDYVYKTGIYTFKPPISRK